MKRTGHVILGLLSALPIVSLFPLMVFRDAPGATAAAAGMAPGAAVVGTASPSAGAVLGLWIAAAGALLGLLLYAFYLVWVVRTARMSAPRKAEWVVALSVAGPIAMPALWFLHFREGEEDAAPAVLQEGELAFERQ